MDAQTLLAVGRALQISLFAEQGRINFDDNSVNTLRHISKTYGISDCIIIVGTLIYAERDSDKKPTLNIGSKPWLKG